MLFLLSLASKVSAQKDSTHLIKQIEIVSEIRVIYHNQGLKTEKLDSTFLANSLNLSIAEVLNKMSTIYIKSYGGGSLASSSFRGGSANHTAILWNGFNLQSPVTGMIDLSLLPVGLFNNMSIQYGGKSATWGSGAIGGAIHLENKDKFNEGSSINLYTGAGSFDQKSILVSANFSNLKFSNSTKFFHTDALHNFKYTSFANEVQETRALPNASANQNTLIQDNYFKIKDNQLLETHIWLQENERKIPPTFFQQNSDAFQEDRSMRFTASYHRYFNLWDLNLRSAFFNEELRYKDSEFSKVSENKSQTYINEALINRKIGRNRLLIGANNTYAQSQSIEFSKLTPFQNKFALFSSFQYLNRKANFIAVASLRKEWVNTNEVPLTWSIGVDYYFTKWLKAKANAAKVYRIPTINDLYWKEGGNQNLLSESGYAFESGLMLMVPQKQKKYSFTFEVTTFSRQIEHWIIWLPNGGFWSPQNLMQVWSRGIETNTTYQLNLKNLKLFSNAKTSYVLSENTASELSSDASINKQLIYVPLYTGQLNYGLTYKNASLMFNHNYTGYRYTSSDHSEYLAPYFLHNVNMAYKLDLKKMNIEFQFQINNILNTKYQVLAARPMPGINFRGGIVFNFKSNYGKS
jgi:iron complex outermembrane receptor protein